MAGAVRHLFTLSIVCAALPAVAATDMVARGKYLARAGDCVACHTAAGGKPYAGGLYLTTPFGNMPTPNITADKEYGIGTWSDDDFYRAMHAGIRKDGAYLYPGLPYQWFTHVTREDVLAIKAYLFSVPPAHVPNKPSTLVFPFTVRPGIAGWNRLYFKEGTFTPDASKSADWNRGAYLVEGLGHCAACHTPKNIAQAPLAHEAFAGGNVDDWYAPNITSDKKEGIGTWSTATIVSYLKKGSAQGKGVVFGPMAQTVHESLSHLSDADLTAIAIYLKSLPPKETYRSGSHATAASAVSGADIYITNCSSCHQPKGEGLAQAVPPLSGNGAVAAQGPQNVIRAVLGGLPADGTYGPMPGFATILTTQQIADVANYVRTSWGNGAPANATAEMVASIAPKTETIIAGTHWCDKPAGGPDEAALQGINDTNLLPSVQKLVADARHAQPNAKQADIVNQLTAAYCPVVLNNASVPKDQRGPKLDQFASLVYTVLHSKE